jgi:dihydrolipoamide dehydrogenase
MYDLIVIGGGPGGYEAAAHAGRLGRRVALIEERRLGGVCLHEGCIPTKTFLKTAGLLAACRQAGRYGIQIDGLRLDLGALQERKRRIVGTLERGVETLMKRSGVTVVRGRARLAGRNQVRVNGAVEEARNILVATGSRPLVPPIDGISSARVLDSGTALELEEAPGRLAILGSDYIGLEFAGFFAAAGTAVTVLDSSPEVRASADADVARRLREALARQGVRFELSTRVRRIEGGAVHYEGPAGEAASVEVDFVLNAAGRAPRVEDLGLEEAGVDFDARGIRTSEAGKTNVPGVWACGDVTGRMLLAHAAAREGIVAVNNMFGLRDRVRYEAIPAVVYTHPEAASAGRTEQELARQGIEYKKAMVPLAVAGRFLIEQEGAAGFVKALVDARYGNVLGVHALGDGVSEFIFGAAWMIEMEMRVAEVRELVFPHPTVSEALKEAVLAAGRE